MFAALEHMFVGVELMSEAVEHKILRSKITFFFRFRQINQPNFDKKQLSVSGGTVLLIYQMLRPF